MRANALFLKGDRQSSDEAYGVAEHNGSVGITYDEILEWRGIKKHSRDAYPGTRVHVTDGYRTEDREQIRNDLALASRYYLRGQHTVARKGKKQTINVDGPYLRVSLVSRPTLWKGTSAREGIPRDEHLGVFFSLGDWINTYEEARNHYLAEIDRRIFQLNPQNQQHELKLALFLVELWRTQAHEGNPRRRSSTPKCALSTSTWPSCRRCARSAPGSALVIVGCASRHSART